jgi:hypothetical protein
MTLKKFGIISFRGTNNIQSGSNMTGTDLCVNKPQQSRSYLNHLVHPIVGHKAKGIMRTEDVVMKNEVC